MPMPADHGLADRLAAADLDDRAQVDALGLGGRLERAPRRRASSRATKRLAVELGHPHAAPPRQTDDRRDMNTSDADGGGRGWRCRRSSGSICASTATSDL